MESSRPSQPSAEFGVRLVGVLPRLRRHLGARVKGAARLDDVIQETILQALESAHSFDENRALWPWLRTLAERSRGRAMDLRHEEPLTVEPAAAERQPVDTTEELNGLLEKLPIPERSVVERYYVRGESVREISTALRIAQGTVQSRLWRARRRLAMVAAALTPAIWFVVSSRIDHSTPSVTTPTFDALKVETRHLAKPTLATIEFADDEPLTWSLEGGTWFEESPSDKDR